MTTTENGQVKVKSAVLLLIIVTLTGLAGLLVVKASISTSLFIITTVVTVAISFLNVEAALYLLIASMLLSPELIVGDLPGKGTGDRGITLRFDDILLVVIGMGWFLKTAVRKELGLFLRTPLNRPIALYIIVCLVSTLLGYMFGRVKLMTGFFFVLKYFEYFIVYFMVVNYLTDKKQIERFVTAMMIVCFIICIVAILQIPGGGRVTAPFEGASGEPNTLGGYLVLMLSITLGLLITPESTQYKKLLSLLVIFIVVSLLATLSRSSWLTLGPMLLTLICFSRKKLVLVITLTIIVLLSPFITPHVVKERALFTITQRQHAGQIKIGGIRLDTSTSARINSWKDALTKDFMEHPVLGYGVTGYRFLDAQYPRVLVETGILGFVAFVLLVFSVYKNALNVSKSLGSLFQRYLPRIFGGVCGDISSWNW
jgi:O-antigen ligase